MSIIEKKSHPSNAEERAYRSIIKLILDGEIQPGDFLLEEDLSRTFHMSRTPVGRALSRLVTEGFIDRLPKKGCFVPVPTPHDAELVFEARIAVETRAAGIAAEQATDAEIDELQHIISLDENAVITFSKESFSSINEAFHLGIAKIAKNPYLERWCKYIYWRSSIYVFYFDSFYMASTVHDVPPQFTPIQHASVIRALKNKNSLEASRLMEEHLRFTFMRLFRRPETPK